MARFENIEAVPSMRMARPNIDLTGRTIHLSGSDGFSNALTYPMPDGVSLLAPDVTIPSGDFESMRSFGELMRKSFAIIFPSLVYTLKVQDEGPIVYAGSNRNFAYQLMERGFVTWGGIARLRAEGPGSLLVNGKETEEYVLDASKAREVQFTLM